MCPITGHNIDTHASMTPRQLEALKSGLVVWCPLCKTVHQFNREALALGGLAAAKA
ncbi:hypothetical protein [Caulobacter sp. S45]|uniref:hypothetical protein n=1 Tax=Caulobacter sp. S45 TaxID=1641861 RepID=UPI001575CB45|nr:hypothetical protein [Caulobacter sp. S45]